MSIQFIKKGGIDTSDATATANDLAKNKTAYVNGQKITGILNDKTNQSMSASAVRTSGKNLVFDENYISGGLYVSPGNNFSLYAKNSNVASNIGLTAEKIKKDETILGVTGTYEGEGGEYNTKVNTTFTSQMNTLVKNITEIPQLDTSNVTNMTNMFYSCSSLTTIPLLNTSSTTNMNGMFSDCSLLTNIPQLDTSNVTDMQNMLSNCRSLTTIPLLNTSKNKNMYRMFYGCSSLTTVPLLDTGSVTQFYGAFSLCNLLTTIPQLDTSNATNMSEMFYGCSSLTTVPLLTTNKVTNMITMFGNCNSLSAESLNNILAMCTNSAVTSNKTLLRIGLSQTQAATCQELSNWDDFVAAGWTTGY